MFTDGLWVQARSRFSFMHGLESPASLVSAAHRAGYAGVALADLDGTWGSVQLFEAAEQVGIAAAVGVSLLTELCPLGQAPQRHVRSEADHAAHLTALSVRGPQGRQHAASAPRVTLFAPSPQIAAVFRATTAAYSNDAGGSHRPVISHAAIAEFTAGGGFILLDDLSEPASLLAAGHLAAARSALAVYKKLTHGRLAFAIAPQRPLINSTSADALRLARSENITAVCLPTIRTLIPADYPTSHLLQAINCAGALSATPPPAKECLRSATAVSEDYCDVAQRVDGDDGGRLHGHTVSWWNRLAGDPRDIGLGVVHPPEDALVTATSNRWQGASQEQGLAGRQRVSAEQNAFIELRDRCHTSVGAWYPQANASHLTRVRDRLDDELRVVQRLGYAAFFLTTATVADLARGRGIRAQARGSAVGSMICHVLGLTPLCPLRGELLMERFCSTLRTDLPDIDLDVESARRHEVYRAIFGHFGTDRVAAVGMVDTYRARSAIRDVGQALGIPPRRLDAIAKAAPWFGASDVHGAFEQLPELAASRLVRDEDRRWLDLVSRLRGVPRHASMHPCGVVITDAGLLDRVSVQATGFEWPMCQLDKDDVETAGLLKVDVLGVRMQSAIATALEQITVTTGITVDTATLPEDDDATFAMVRSTQAIGVFQVESPGQRALAGKMCPASRDDLTAQISLFRPGPVQGDMITPYVAARHGHPGVSWPAQVAPIVENTGGVVVWHEQVIRILAATAGLGFAEADMARRRLATESGRAEVRAWWFPAAVDHGLTDEQAEQVWDVVAAFAAFGFCKAHAAAFGQTTYESAWLKTHYPAQFFAGLMQHLPGLYPPRLLLAEARRLGIVIELPCIQHPTATWQAHIVGPHTVTQKAVSPVEMASKVPVDAAVPQVSGTALRTPLSVVEGITADEVERLCTGAPYGSIAEVWQRTGVTAATLENLAVVGALRCVADQGLTSREVYAATLEVTRHGLRSNTPEQASLFGTSGATEVAVTSELALTTDLRSGEDSSHTGSVAPEGTSGATSSVDMSQCCPAGSSDVHTELGVTGLDLTDHILTSRVDALRRAGVCFASELHEVPEGAHLYVAGIRSVVHTPPTRSGIRVVFISLDDPTGVVDVAFFPSAQGKASAVAMKADQVVVRGVLKREAPRSVSIAATGAWKLDEFLAAREGLARRSAVAH